MQRRSFLTQSAGLLSVSVLPLTNAWSAESEPKSYDVIVYGGTPCGIASAVMAAREGVSVLLIEPTKHVGGMSTSGLNTAEIEHLLKWTIGGFADEFYRRLGKFYGTNKAEYTFESSVTKKAFLELLKEAGVTVHYGASVASSAIDGLMITDIELSDGSKLKATVFIDASYEGDLMSRTEGIDYAIGREAKLEFNEEAAGIRFDKIKRKGRTVDENGKFLPGIMAWVTDLKEGSAQRAPACYNFRLTVAKDEKLQVPFPSPKNYDPSRFALLADWLAAQVKLNKPAKLADLFYLYPRRNGKFELNNKQDAPFSLGYLGGQADWPDTDVEKRAEIFQDHWDYTLGLLHFLTNEPAVPKNLRVEMQALGLHKDEFTDNVNLPYQLYVREARRMRGEYVMTQKDVQVERRKPDSIGISSHFIDCPYVQRLAVSENEFLNEGRIWRLGFAYQIPYRALTPDPQKCTNLLVPGAASFTHVAFCTYRVEPVWMIAGHAAGVAAALAAQQKVAVQKVSLAALQQKLRAQKQIVDFIAGQPEKCTALNGPAEF